MRESIIAYRQLRYVFQPSKKVYQDRVSTQPTCKLCVKVETLSKLVSCIKHICKIAPSILGEKSSFR